MLCDIFLEVYSCGFELITMRQRSHTNRPLALPLDCLDQCHEPTSYVISYDTSFHGCVSHFSQSFIPLVIAVRIRPQPSNVSASPRKYDYGLSSCNTVVWPSTWQMTRTRVSGSLAQAQVKPLAFYKAGWDFGSMGDD